MSIKRQKNAELHTITVINKSSINVDRHLRVKNKTASAAGGYSTRSPTPNVSLDPGVQASLNLLSFMEISLGPDNSRTEPIADWSLEITAIRGVTFLGDQHKSTPYTIELPVVPGGVYTIIDDVDKPVLTEEQFLRVASAVREALECTPTDERIDSVFDDLAASFGMSGDWLGKAFRGAQFDTTRGKSERITWRDHYWTPVVVGDMACARRIIRSQRYVLEVYWRALDRTPGGNADYITIRYTFVVEPDSNENYVYVYEYSNWDGGQSLTGPYVPASVEKRSHEFGDVFEKLLSTLESNNNEFNIVDRKLVDHDELDTEWSSVEMLLQASPLWSPCVFPHLEDQVQQRIFTLLLINNRQPLRWRLSKAVLHCVLDVYMQLEDVADRCVLRVHQSAVSAMATPVKPSPVQRAVLEGAAALVGMKRVINWGAYNDFYTAADGTQCRAGEDRVEYPTRSDGYIQYIQPIAFYFH